MTSFTPAVLPFMENVATNRPVSVTLGHNADSTMEANALLPSPNSLLRYEFRFGFGKLLGQLFGFGDQCFEEVAYVLGVFVGARVLVRR